MALIGREELKFGRRGIFANLYAWAVGKIFAVDRVNALADGMSRSAADRPAATLLQRLGIAYRLSDHDLANVPRQGAAIVVSNHPTGAPDGIILIDILSRIRPDVKFMGNFLLDRIPFLNEYFIAVDPFTAGANHQNIRGLRRAEAHVREGGLLVVFPAGEVATWQNGFRNIKDKPWGRSIVRFIRRAECPVIPVCIEARNSMMFRLAGKIHPLLRTALLPREMLNKHGKTIGIRIGSGVQPKRTAELSADDYGRYLRANVEYLCPAVRRTPRRRKNFSCGGACGERIVEAVPREALQHELDSLPGECLLLEQSGYKVFFASSGQIPLMLSEIGRMREITFREIGEGSLRKIDTDHYDDYYRQLFIWDTASLALVGAYRMGFGSEIMDGYGLRGFYTDTLFRMDARMEPVMRRTIELGRSFVTHDYQRKPASLMLLWKGILHVLLRNTGYRYLMGPASISGEFSDASKTLIVEYLRRHHMDRELSRLVRPATGLQGIGAGIDLSLVANITSGELINKLVADMECNHFAIPVLIRKYLNLNSRVLGFNVDPGFSDSLDALMLLDLKQVPPQTIELLSKEMSGIDVLSRFKNLSDT